MNIVIEYKKEKDELFYQKILKVVDELDYDLIGFFDGEGKESEDVFLGFPLYRMDQVHDLNYDVVLILDNMPDQYADNCHVPLGRIRNIFWLLTNKMLLKYEHSNDREIQEILKWWESYEISVYNYMEFHTDPTFDLVYYDEKADLFYIWFETVTGTKKKMYFPREYPFWVDGKDVYVVNVLIEQCPGSPHLYIKENHEVEDGDVIIDAGVCEGNFALRYIDIASYVYLFEPDKVWEKPLYYTFRDFGDQVRFYGTALGEESKTGCVRLDDVIPSIWNKRGFLKMDVDGPEVKVLRGGKQLLRENRIKCSICAYHNPDDEFKIKALLHHCGYRTSISSGYMVYIYDPDIWESADFRRGMVYGDKI